MLSNHSDTGDEGERIKENNVLNFALDEKIQQNNGMNQNLDRYMSEKLQNIDLMVQTNGQALPKMQSIVCNIM